MFISFHGATNEVTGSCHLLEIEDARGKIHRLLIDCGMFQGARYAEKRNEEPFAFDPKTLDAIFVTHAHADHTGRLPKLIKEGYQGPVFMTPPTFSLMKIILEDSFHIMKEDTYRDGDPLLFTQEDLDLLFQKCSFVNYHQQTDIAPGISVMFHDAGHILGSAFISIDAEEKRIIFSGDIGNNAVPILPDTEHLSHADVVICESTYGNRIHESSKERSLKLKECVQEILTQKGVLLIPSFSVERTQELLYELNNMLLQTLSTSIPIFLDSPMAIRATEIYRQYKQFLQFDAPIFSDPDKDFFSFPNLKETLNSEASKAILDIPSPKIIIAGSGMMSGGRIMHHVKHYVSSPHNTILFIGYQAEGTLGRKIFEGEEQINIFGDWIHVRAHVQAIGAFSAHGDKNKLTTWLRPEEGDYPQKIFLVHGEKEAKEQFATHLKETLQTEVCIPEFQSRHEV